MNEVARFRLRAEGYAVTPRSEEVACMCVVFNPTVEEMEKSGFVRNYAGTNYDLSPRLRS